MDIAFGKVFFADSRSEIYGHLDWTHQDQLKYRTYSLKLNLYVQRDLFDMFNISKEWLP